MALVLLAVCGGGSRVRTAGRRFQWHWWRIYDFMVVLEVHTRVRTRIWRRAACRRKGSMREFLRKGSTREELSCHTVASRRCCSQVEKAVTDANQCQAHARCMPRGVRPRTSVGRPCRRVPPPELTCAGQGSGLGLTLAARLVESGLAVVLTA
jgi:hypothetical protein